MSDSGKDEKQPHNLRKPCEIEEATDRIAGLIGGLIAGFALSILGLILLTNFGVVSLNAGLFYGILGVACITGAIGMYAPKWFAWIFELVMWW